MKIGDRVRILFGDHQYEGSTGVITNSSDELNKTFKNNPYDFEVKIEDPNEDVVDFYSFELEVINETV